MRTAPLVVCLLLGSLLGGGASSTPPPDAAGIFGFSAARAHDQHTLEGRLDSAIDPQELMAWSKRMTVRPHHVGSPGAEENARFMLELFRSWGYEAELETFWVLFPTPKVRELELLSPVRYKARLQEEILPGDATSRIAVTTGLPPFNAYSADGDVTAELVYVNRGVPEDYRELERRGIDVRGKIVIARYGGSWRGIKPKVAAEHGAIGCLIWNDPGDDGYAAGVPYPEGPMKHEWGVQRGSVLDLPRRPGDPLTPGIGATRDAQRLARDQADNLMTIPVMPIAWKDALPLLESMAGPVAQRSWRGALPITYRLGPGPARVRLRLQFDWSLKPAHNVIARLAGAERPDQWIVRGNHHDAWVIGAADPISGMIALLAEAKAVGALARAGQRPRRTIVYAAWDAEEPALLGSTEWAEHHAAALRDHAVAYINTDGNSRGFFSAGGSHALETLVHQVAEAVTDPQTGASVGRRSRAAQLAAAAQEAPFAPTAEETKRLLAGDPLELDALGSGSDFTPFLQHLGIATLNIGFGGESETGEYHTTFDSFDHYSRYQDPGFPYGKALASVGARLTLRLANADVLPFHFARTAATVQRYLDDLIQLADRRREEVERHNRLVREGFYRLAADPKETFVVPAEKEPVPHLNFAPLENARDRVLRAARAADEAVARALAGSGGAVAPGVALDRALYTSERQFIDPSGLPGRPWYRHLLYAPGMYTGYGVKTLPGVREAIEEGRFAEAEDEVAALAERLLAYAAHLEGIAQDAPAAGQ